MEKRKWYNKNITTSLLGFGAMRLKTINGEIDEEKGFALFDKAYQNGVNYFDTAMPYTDGKNETFVGKALKRYPRESFYLATKCSLFMFKTKDDFLNVMDRQLKALQTEYIDFYLLHAMNKDKFKLIKEWNVMEQLEKWKEEGKIRYIGFSFHDDYATFKEILDYYPWDFCQIQLNYMDQDIQQGIKGYYDLEKKKIPVIIMEPLKGGKLAHFNKDIAKNFTDYNKNASLASWALRWLGSLEGVKVILSGMNEDDQLVDNLNVFNEFRKMDVEELEIVEKVRVQIKNSTKVDCTACKYCMPCPKGVNIAGNFRIYNNYGMYEDINEARSGVESLKKNDSYADKCVKCGLCLSKCPQSIKIPNELENMMNDFKRVLK